MLHKLHVDPSSSSNKPINPAHFCKHSQSFALFTCIWGLQICKDLPVETLIFSPPPVNTLLLTLPRKKALDGVRKKKSINILWKSSNRNIFIEKQEGFFFFLFDIYGKVKTVSRKLSVVEFLKCIPMNSDPFTFHRKLSKAFLNGVGDARGAFSKLESSCTPVHAGVNPVLASLVILSHISWCLVFFLNAPCGYVRRSQFCKSRVSSVELLTGVNLEQLDELHWSCSRFIHM